VLFVEDSEDLREMFVELVAFVLKRRCIGVGSYEESWRSGIGRSAR
jgi:hypothetical protein